MMRRDRPDIVYVHQGAQRIYDIVAAISRAGYSCRYLSGYYYREDGLPERLLAALPVRWTGRLRDRLHRRHGTGMGDAVVERSWIQDLMMAIEVRTPRLFPNFILLRNFYIDLRAAVRVLMLRPRAVIACDTSSLLTLRAAKRVGAVAILDQVIGHITAADRILSEERELHPGIAGTWRPSPARLLRRCTAEVLAADHILAPSPYVRDTLIAVGAEPGRISILPYGADLAKFGRGDEPPVPPFRILFAGQIGLRKGVLYLLEAVRAAGLKDAEVVLLGNVDGDGEWLAPYRGLFVHRSHLAHRDIPPVFAGAHIYVYPSLHEGSTVSIYEAMATGLPVVATPNSGSFIRDGEDGFILPIRDVAALRDRIVRLHDEPGLRRRMGAAAQRNAADLTWDSYSRRIARILDGLLK